MTGDEFTARYRLREQLNDGEIVSYLAADARGGTAFVHVFRGEFAPEFDATLLDPDGSAALREVLDVEGIEVVVTDVIEPFSTFEAWVAEHQRVAEPEKEGPGAFTRIFRVQSPEGPPAPPQEPGAESGPPEAVSAPLEAGVTGEDAAPVAGDTTEVEPPMAPEEEAESEGPGEFTRAFRALGTPNGPPAAPPPTPEGPSLPAGLPPVPERPAAPPPASTAPPPFPGVPRREVPTSRPPSPPAASTAPPTPPPAPRPPEPSSPEPPGERGTGTFTRIMGALAEGPGSGAPPQPPLGSPPPAPSGSPPPPPGGLAPPRPGGAPPPRPGDAPRPPGAPPPPYPGGLAPPPRPGSTPFGAARPARPVDTPPPPASPAPAPPPPGMSGMEPSPPMAPLQPPPAPPGDQGATPGPYTQAMRAYRDSGQSRSPSPPAQPEAPTDAGAYGSGSYLDRLQSKGRPEDTAAPRPPGGAMPPPPPAGRLSVPPVPSGPSDYTRVIRGAVPPSMGRSGSDPSAYGAPPPAPAPAPAPPPPKAASRTPVIIALVATVAVVAALIVFFALRSG